MTSLSLANNWWPTLAFQEELSAGPQQIAGFDNVESVVYALRTLHTSVSATACAQPLVYTHIPIFAIMVHNGYSHTYRISLL